MPAYKRRNRESKCDYANAHLHTVRGEEYRRQTDGKQTGEPHYVHDLCG